MNRAKHRSRGLGGVTGGCGEDNTILEPSDISPDTADRYGQTRLRCSVPNCLGVPRGTTGIMPRGRDGQGGMGPLAVVRCRAN